MIPFTDQEYKRRVTNVQERMREQGIDCLIVSDPSNMTYLSGYNVWSQRTPQILILGADQEEPIWFGRGIDEVGAEKTTWLSDENIRGYETVRSQVNGYLNDQWPYPLQGATEIIEELGLAKKTIGLEKALPFFPALGHEVFQNTLSDATFVDASLLVTQEKVVKSDAEIEYMKQAAKLSQAGMQAAIDTIEPGVEEAEVAAKVYQGLINGADDVNGEYPVNPVLMGAGKMNDVAHFTWSTENSLQEGDMVSVEVSGSKHRYHAPMSRSVVAGSLPSKVEKHAEDVKAGLEAAIDAIEPGITCEEVVDVWRDTPAGDTSVEEVKLGYEVGIGLATSWTDLGGPALRPGDETVIQPNMTFHMLSTHTFPLDISVEISDTIRVTENGAESLMDFPRKVFAK